eukprot:10611601-Karenia_brevis.AAC.1
MSHIIALGSAQLKPPRRMRHEDFAQEEKMMYNADVDDDEADHDYDNYHYRYVYMNPELCNAHTGPRP